MVMRPRLKPNSSRSTFTTGARQLVVQLALEMTWCCPRSYLSSFTPRTMVMSSPLAGAEMITFFAPASRCLAASSRLVKRPVDSMTMSTSRSPQGSFGGVLLGQDPDLVAVHHEGVFADLHGTRVAAVDGVVPEQVGERPGVGEVVHRHEVEVRHAGLLRRPQHVPADAAEAVDRHANRHVPSWVSW